MNKKIIPKAAVNKKSAAAAPAVDRERVIAGWLEEIEQASAALQSLRHVLQNWQQGTSPVSAAEVDRVAEMLRDANLGDWAKDGWAKLREIILGQSLAR